MNRLLFLKDYGCIRKGEKIHYKSIHGNANLIHKEIAQYTEEVIVFNARKINEKEISDFIDYKMKELKRELIEFIRLRQ